MSVYGLKRSFLILSNILPKQTNRNLTYSVNWDHAGIIIVRLRIMCFIFIITITHFT